ncbi:lipopolysaccharide-binding protein-like [Capricornis sumatraensis]|uniref:lipopolysaccharide-binding protein-like n=1 Tax=Capricornis sumatraensis TaxID=34865 RepID=UPI0036043FB6
MARPYYMVVALLLLAEFTGFGEGTPNPGFVARITGKGLEYARQYGEATLKNELSTTKLPDLSGSYGIGWLGSVNYVFSGMRIHRFLLQDSQLSLHPGQGIKASLSNNNVSVGGNWKVKKSFITLHGTFDLSVDGISILVSLNLGKDQSGQPSVSVIHCHNSISHVSVEISGHISWILNLFHERIENNVKPILEQKICEMVRKSAISRLEPYLRTLPGLEPSSLLRVLSVTLMIDQIAGIDYSLVGAPQVTSQGLDTPFKGHMNLRRHQPYSLERNRQPSHHLGLMSLVGTLVADVSFRLQGEFFGRNWNTSVPFDAPPITLPQKHDHMIYFAVSEYAFNTASRVYYQAGQMKFTIQNKHIPLDFPIQLHTSSFWAIIPQYLPYFSSWPCCILIWN